MRAALLNEELPDEPEADEAMEEVNQEKVEREAHKVAAGRLPGYRKQLAGFDDKVEGGEVEE